jgi:hypothetical protein
MIYETMKTEEETEDLMMSFNADCHERELEGHALQIKDINKKIEEERQLETQLTKIIQQMEE